MKKDNEKLKIGLKEALSLDIDNLQKKIEGTEPHVFSDTFNRKMEVLFPKSNSIPIITKSDSAL